MSWTQTQLDALERAMANGTTRVQYADRVVNYRDLPDMIKLRDMIRSELGLTVAGRTHAYGSFSKGLR